MLWLLHKKITGFFPFPQGKKKSCKTNITIIIGVFDGLQVNIIYFLLIKILFHIFWHSSLKKCAAIKKMKLDKGT